MRKIKFRAWNKKHKIMVYSDEDDSSDYWDEVQMSDIEIVNYCLSNDDYEWMQFTGLKDKNGKEIYEGDIVKADDTEQPLPVVYDPPWFTLKDWKHGLTYILEHDELEVIGNIYENPELFE